MGNSRGRCAHDKTVVFLFWVPLAMTSVAPAQAQRPEKHCRSRATPDRRMSCDSKGVSFSTCRSWRESQTAHSVLQGRQFVLTLPGCEASARVTGEGDKAGFSRPFMKAAIEAMGSIREWGGILQATVQDRYPLGTPMTGNTIIAYQERAADSVALAAAAASADSDYRGLEVLRNEFNNLKAWTDRFFQARKSLTAQYMTLTDTPLQDDDEAQKIMRCGQFLAQMFSAAVLSRTIRHVINVGTTGEEVVSMGTHLPGHSVPKGVQSY